MGYLYHNVDKNYSYLNMLLQYVNRNTHNSQIRCMTYINELKCVCYGGRKLPALASSAKIPGAPRGESEQSTVDGMSRRRRSEEDWQAGITGHPATGTFRPTSAGGAAAAAGKSKPTASRSSNKMWRETSKPCGWKHVIYVGWSSERSGQCHGGGGVTLAALGGGRASFFCSFRLFGGPWKQSNGGASTNGREPRGLLD